MWLYLLNIIDNTLYEGLTYAPVCLAMVLSFRMLRFPDITMEGSFILGAAITAALTVHWDVPPALALAAGVSAGALAGTFTMFLAICCRIDKLLSGALSAFVCYSISLIVMGGFIAYAKTPTLLTPFEEFDLAFRQQLPERVSLHPGGIAVFAAIAACIKVVMDLGLRTERGLVMSAVGHNERAVVHCGINPVYYKFFGLAMANALVALSGSMVSMKEGSVSATRGIGLIIVALTAYVVGEQLLGQRRSSSNGSNSGKNVFARLRTAVRRRLERCELSTAAIVGALFYFLILRLGYDCGVRPELPKLLMGCYIIIAIGDRAWLRSMVKLFWKKRNARIT